MAMAKRTYKLYCAVFGCLNTSATHPDITFFKLPANSERSDTPSGSQENPKDSVKETPRQKKRKKQREKRLKSELANSGIDLSNKSEKDTNLKNRCISTSDVSQNVLDEDILSYFLDENNEECSADSTNDNKTSTENSAKLLNYLNSRNVKFAVNFTDTFNKSENDKIFSLKEKMTKYYLVEQTVFLDQYRSIISDEELSNYRLFKVKKMEEAGAVHRSEDDLTEDDSMEPLYITTKVIGLGVIINNNVYLPHDSWHTIRRLSTEVYSCTVCQLQCDKPSLAAHKGTAQHAKKLQEHYPLKKFDLSIIRKINENFHCGVCNAIFPVTSYREHENSKSHEENLLFCINKVSDLMWDKEENKTTQTIDINNIRPPNNAPCQYPGERHCGNLENTLGYPQTDAPYQNPDENSWPLNVPDNPVTTGQLTPPCENQIISNWPGNFWADNGLDDPEMTVPCQNPDEGNWPNFWLDSPDRTTELVRTPGSDRSESNSRSKSDSPFNFGKMYKDVKIYEEDVEEYTPPIEGVSYASMASKPRVDVPKFLKIDLGTKEVRVKFESWNMITPTNYCMVCTDFFPVRAKIAHCMAEEHKQKLSKCTIVGAFEDYLIRNVSEKFYHCGHCNNLQYKSDIQMHIEKYHPNKNAKTRPSFQENTITKIDIFQNFTFNPFGANITVSHLAFHTLIRVERGYMCAICDVFIEGDLIAHVYEMTHMQLLKMTPFIKPFQFHLTRAIRGSLHCAICNILVPVNGITNHNIEPVHTDLLARALGMVKKERPVHEVKYQRREPAEFTTDLEKFLSTLPPDTRGALSMLKIKNPKGEMFQLNDATSNSSSSNSPVHLSKDDTQNPQIGVNTPSQYKEPEGTNYPNNVLGCNIYYPKKGAEGIKPINQPVEKQTVRSDVTYPNIGVEGITEIYPKGNAFNLFKPGQMIPLSVIESGIYGVRTGSPDVPVLPFFNNRPESVVPEGRPMVEQSGDLGYKRPVDNAVMGSHSQPKVRVNEYLQPIPQEANGAQKMEKREIKKEKDGKTKEKPVVTIKTEREKSESNESEDDDEFIMDETVLLKLKTTYFKVTASAYHSLVHMGSGARHCFVCALRLDSAALGPHVRSRKHSDSLHQNKFLHNYGGQLFRQMYRMYHCAICNVTMTRKEVKMHLEWPTHIQKYDISCKKLSKKLLNVLKNVKEVSVETQKEFVHVNIAEPINIITYVPSTREDLQETYVESSLEKKSLMIMLDGNVMKISFDSWHGILVSKGGIKCIICQQELTEEDLLRHIKTKYHGVALGISFDKQHYPALIRKINNDIVNCVICNLELQNDDSVIDEHIHGRKHVKNHHTIIEKTSQTDSYSDCYKNPIIL